VAPRRWASTLAPAILCAATLAIIPPDAPAAVQPDSRAYDAASGLLQRGLYDLALPEYDAFLEQHPDHELAPAARYGRAVCLVRLDRHEDALPELDRLGALDDFEFAAEVEYLRGHAHLRAARYAEAAARFGALAERFPDHATAAEARALRVEALYRAGRHSGASAALHDDAPPRAVFFAAMADLELERFEPAAERFAAVLEAVLEAGPEGAHGIGDLADRAALLRAQSLDRLGALPEAADAYRLAVARDSAFTAAARMGLGELLEREGDGAGARVALAPVRDVDGELGARASLVLGRVALREGDHTRAAEDFERARRTHALADEASLWRAKALLAADDPTSAAEVLRRALRTDPSQDGVFRAEMTYDLGVALAQAGQRDDAVRVFERFPRAFPDHPLLPDARYALALVHHGAGSFAEAEAPIHRLLALAARGGAEDGSPSSADIRFLAAENAFLLNNLDAARERLTLFRNEHPTDPRSSVAGYRLGLTLHRLGEPETAEPLLRRAAEAVSHNPAFAPALTALAEIARDRGDWPAAARWYDAAAAAPGAKDPAGALLRGGVAFARAGDHASAADRYRAAIDLDADGPHAAHARLELGRSLLRIGDPAGAELQLGRITEHETYGVHAWRLLAEAAERRGDSELASERLARASDAAAPDLLATTEYERGQALLRSGDAEAAADAFASAAVASDDETDRRRARAWRAIALGRAGQNDVAIGAIDELGDTDTLDRETRHALLYERARALAATGRGGEAQRAYAALAADRASGAMGTHAALELADLRLADNDHAGALRALDRLLSYSQAPAPLIERAAYRAGVAARALGEHARAAEAFERFFDETSTGDADLLASAAWQYGDVLSAMARHADAAERFAYAAETAADPDTIAASLLRLGDTHAARSDWDASERAFAQFLERFADRPLAVQAHFGVGWAREHRGETDAAIAAYEQAAASGAGPTSARAQFQIGECLYAKGAYDEAIRAFLRTDILFAHPEWAAAALFEAGRCFEETGRPSEARAQYEAVADRFGQTEWADLAAGRLGALSTALP